MSKIVLTKMWIVIAATAMATSVSALAQDHSTEARYEEALSKLNQLIAEAEERFLDGGRPGRLAGTRDAGASSTQAEDCTKDRAPSGASDDCEN